MRGFTMRRFTPFALGAALAGLLLAAGVASALHASAGSSPHPAPPTGCAKVTSADGLRAALSAHRDACVVRGIGDVELSELGGLGGLVVTTEGGGSMGEIELNGTTGLTIEGARFRSIELRHAGGTKILDNRIGGTPRRRVYDQLIFAPERSDNVRIEDNDIGWTLADDSGNTGYGCRCYGELNNLRFVGNRVHDIAADGFQGVEGRNVLIARNDFGPVGANPGSSEHSDDIQIPGNGPGLRIVDNWIHNQGYFAGKVAPNSGSIYIHGGTSNPVLIENNLITENQGRTEICGLGTGGVERSNITIRRNTWLEGGLAYQNFPGFEWDCSGGSGNRVEGNIAIDADGGFAQDGSLAAAAFGENIWGRPGKVKFEPDGDCASARCGGPGRAIGFRAPRGWRWNPELSPLGRAVSARGRR